MYRLQSWKEWKDCVHLSLSVYECVYVVCGHDVCVRCVQVHVRTRMSMSRHAGRDQRRCSNIGPCLPLQSRVYHVVCSYTACPRLGGPTFRGFSCLCFLPHGRNTLITDMYCICFMWVLGIQTQVLIFVQVLYPLSYLSGPSFVTFLKSIYCNKTPESR